MSKGVLTVLSSPTEVWACILLASFQMFSQLPFLLPRQNWQYALNFAFYVRWWLKDRLSQQLQLMSNKTRFIIIRGTSNVIHGPISTLCGNYPLRTRQVGLLGSHESAFGQQNHVQRRLCTSFRHCLEYHAFKRALESDPSRACTLQRVTDFRIALHRTVWSGRTQIDKCFGCKYGFRSGTQCNSLGHW